MRYIEPHGHMVSRVTDDYLDMVTRSEEHTSELQSHSDLHPFPTRRSSDLDGIEQRRASQSVTGAAQLERSDHRTDCGRNHQGCVRRLAWNPIETICVISSRTGTWSVASRTTISTW